MRPAIRHQPKRLKYLMPGKGAGGVTYWYFARDRKNLIRLPDAPHDHPDFLTAYAAALAASGPVKGDTPARSGTVAALIIAAETSPAFRAVSPGYRAALTAHFAELTATVGAAPFRQISAAHIRKNVGDASNPTMRRKVWRFLFAFGIDAGLLTADPSASVAPPKRATKSVSHPPWTADEIAAYRARFPIGTSARGAMELLHFTAARISDAVRIGPGMVGSDGVLAFVQKKTGDQAFVPWTCQLPAHAASSDADRATMHKALAAMSTGQSTYLATSTGKPRSSVGLGNLIRESAAAAGFDKSAHGLRATRAIALAENGASTHQIGAWTGHKSLKEIEHYTTATNRRRAVMGAACAIKDPADPAAN